MLIAGGLTVPAMAAESAELSGKEIDLGEGYKLIVPGYVESKTITTKYWSGEPKTVGVIVRERPKEDANGNFQIYQIVTTD